MRGGTELGRVRGLGSARHGAGHWWLQRVTALGNIVLVLWLVLSLALLPGYDYETVRAWLRSPLVAAPMALVVINTFTHFRMGLQVVAEDYSQAGARITWLALVHVWTFGAGALALFSILKVALTGAAA